MEQYIDEFGNLQFRIVGNNTQFYPGTTVPIATPFSGNQSVFPFKDVKELPKTINYGSSDDGYHFKPFDTALPSGIVTSTAAKQFEEPYRIIGGEKVYISDVIGTKQAEEKANFFQEPKGILTQAKDFFTKTVPNIASSAIDFIPGMRFIKGLDKFDTLPYQDRKFIKSAMDMKGIPGSGIYVDPSSGLLKDFRGKNVRSLFGNYAESIEKGYADKVSSLEKSKNRWEEKYGSLDNINEYGKTWNEMNKRNLAEFTFLTNMKNKFDQQKEELKQKYKKLKSINIHGGDTPASPPGGGDGRYGVGADGQKSYDFGQGFGVSATTGGPVSNRTGRGRQDY